METHRDEFFLATKTGERTRALAFEEIERSLERLRTDHVDLIHTTWLTQRSGRPPLRVAARSP